MATPPITSRITQPRFSSGPGMLAPPLRPASRVTPSAVISVRQYLGIALCLSFLRGRLRGRSSLIKVFACNLYAPERKRPSGRCCPQRAAISYASSSRHPCPPMLPQGIPDQLRRTLAFTPGSVKAILVLLTKGHASIAAGAARRGEAKRTVSSIRLQHSMRSGGGLYVEPCKPRALL